MRIGLAARGELRQFAERKLDGAKRGATMAARRMAVRAKLALREDVRKAGLGDRIANTWQDKAYPRNKTSLRPAGLVYSRAPDVMEGHAGATIRHREGLMLAIPTVNTPRKGRRRATPLEVEGIYNQDLIIVPLANGNSLAFVDAVRSRNGKTWRRATRSRTGKLNRKAERVLMFVLVPQVTLRKRLDWERIVDEHAQQWPVVLAEDVAREMGKA